jgi:hypothetical protein
LVWFGLATWKSALKARPWALRQMTSLVLLSLNISLNYSLLPDQIDHILIIGVFTDVTLKKVKDGKQESQAITLSSAMQSEQAI